MIDEAFLNCGNKAGFELYRIENFKPVLLPSSSFGKFHSGDSYILLATLEDNKGKKTYNAHFWLGNESSQDEKGTAAYKTVELDNALGGAAVQYRELQGCESDLFLSYFQKNGIEYLDGGVKSGFNTVEKDVYKTRLLLCKGRRTVRISEVPLAKSSLNRSDCFILDKGLTILVFNGPEANKFEKLKAIQTADHLNSDSRSGRAFVSLVEGTDSVSKEFWDLFGGYTDPMTLPACEDEVESKVKHAPKLFHITNANGGSVEFKEVPLNDGKLTKNQLKGEDCFMILSNEKVYVWVGKGSSLDEKRESMTFAAKYCEENGINASNICRVAEGCESSEFKAQFSVWNQPMNFKHVSTNVAGKVEEKAIDVSSLLALKAEEESINDNGNGSTKVWRIENFQKVEVAKEQYGQFYSGDAYIILYEYKDSRNADKSIIYFWLGNNCSADEKGAAALLTKELDDEMGGRPLQIRLLQGKEPSHFTGLFKGTMVVHQGGKASGFKNVNSEDSYDTDGVSLFHIKGTTAKNTYACQVEEKTSSLNSLDEFILVVPHKVMVWHGGGGNEVEKEVAATIARTLSHGREVECFDEGNEPSEFWEFLGGKGEYAEFADSVFPREARLFHASTASGAYKVEEVCRFTQHDLIDDDIMLLDTFTQIFVWIGSKSTEEEKMKSFDFAARFCREANDGRDPSIPVIIVKAGEEPSLFTCHFHGWDCDLASRNVFLDPYEQKLKEMRDLKAKKEQETMASSSSSSSSVSTTAASPAPAKRGSVSGDVPIIPPMSVITPTRDAPPPVNFAAPIASAAVSTGPLEPIPVSAYLSYAMLKDQFPEGVDRTRKEEYLSDDEFAKLMGCDKAAFRAMPAWKRNDKKKSTGLF